MGNPISRRSTAQVNIRSDFVRSLVDELVHQSGMKATEIVEDALRGYVLPGSTKRPDGLVQCGRRLVMPSRGGNVVSLEEAEAALEATRTSPD